MLGLIKTRLNEMEQTFRAMSGVKVDSKRLTDYLANIYSDSTDPAKQMLIQRNQAWSKPCFDQGRGSQMQRATGTLGKKNPPR
jgi:hypothetical protein